METSAANRLMTAAQDGKISGDDLQIIFDSKWVGAVIPMAAKVLLALKLAESDLCDFCQNGAGGSETLDLIRAVIAEAEEAK